MLPLQGKEADDHHDLPRATHLCIQTQPIQSTTGSRDTANVQLDLDAATKSDKYSTKQGMESSFGRTAEEAGAGLFSTQAVDAFGAV